LSEEIDNLKNRPGGGNGAVDQVSDELHSRIAVLEQENVNLQKELNEARNECEALQNQVDPAFEQKMENLLNELQKQKEEVQKTTQSSRLQNRI